MCVGIDWKIGPECEPELIRSQKSTSDSPPLATSYRSGRPRSWPYSWARHADTRVLGLDDVVGDLEAGVADLCAAHDRAAVRPDRVGALGTAATGLVLAGVHEHDVVDDAVRLVDVAVTVQVALVLDVVVGEREVRLLLGESVTASTVISPGPSLSGWPFMSCMAPACHLPSASLKQVSAA
jgi:hypothetical protein